MPRRLRRGAAPPREAPATDYAGLPPEIIVLIASISLQAYAKVKQICKSWGEAVSRMSEA